MKIPKTALRLPDKDNGLKPASEMDTTELARWYAFCNGLKFINLGESQFKESIKETDIPYNAILNYTQVVSGDIIQYVESGRGLPMKYSLHASSVDARNIEEIVHICP